MRYICKSHSNISKRRYESEEFLDTSFFSNDGDGDLTNVEENNSDLADDQESDGDLADDQENSCEINFEQTTASHACLEVDSDCESDSDGESDFDAVDSTDHEDD